MNVYSECALCGVQMCIQSILSTLTLRLRGVAIYVGYNKKPKHCLSSKIVQSIVSIYYNIFH